MLQIITGGFGCLLILFGVILMGSDLLLNSHATLLNQINIQGLILTGVGLVLINQARRP